MQGYLGKNFQSAGIMLEMSGIRAGEGINPNASLSTGGGFLGFRHSDP
jgi:hypothetical protein